MDGLVAQMETRLGPVLVCGPGCSSCCQDDLTVLEIEAALIAARAPRLLREEEPGPAGRAALSWDGQGRCRIYPWRPYVCRTQGLPLRWLTGDEGEAEGRDICPLNRDEMAARGTGPCRSSGRAVLDPGSLGGASWPPSRPRPRVNLPSADTLCGPCLRAAVDLFPF